MIIGSTISFAGNPKINAVNITPSRPKISPNSFKKLAIMFIIAVSFIVILVKSHIISHIIYSYIS